MDIYEDMPLKFAMVDDMCAEVCNRPNENVVMIWRDSKNRLQVAFSQHLETIDAVRYLNAAQNVLLNG